MVKCPKCSSDQVAAQKKGFSGGKAIAGAIIAGPVGALAGTHGSGKIKVHCLECGHSWDPTKERERGIQEANQKAFQEINQWRGSVIRYFDDGKIDEAEKTYLSRLSFTEKVPDINSAVKKLKFETISYHVFMIMAMGFVIWFLIWLLA